MSKFSPSAEVARFQVYSVNANDKYVAFLATQTDGTVLVFHIDNGVLTFENRINGTSTQIASYKRLYQAGDTVTLKSMLAAGYLTSGSTTMAFALPISQGVVASKVSVTSLRANVRQNGKYINPQGTAIDGGYQYVGNYTVSAWLTESGISVEVRHSSALPNSTNNDVVIADIHQITFTLS